MWISAWILVASAGLGQPNLPPFSYKEDCEKARQVFLGTRMDRYAKCIESKIWVRQ